jgi:hypothetical protein
MHLAVTDHHQVKWANTGGAIGYDSSLFVVVGEVGKRIRIDIDWHVV